MLKVKNLHVLEKYYKGRGRKWHFLKPKLKVKGNNVNNELQLLFFELWKTAVEPPLPPKTDVSRRIFFSFSQQIRQFSISEKWFFHKNFPHIFTRHKTLTFFGYKSVTSASSLYTSNLTNRADEHTYHNYRKTSL